MIHSEETEDAREEAERVVLLTGADLRRLERGEAVKVGDVVVKVDFSDGQP